MDLMSAVESFYLPKISTSLPKRCHPAFLSVGRQANEWFFNKMNIKDEETKKQMAEWKVPLYANLVVPFGKPEQALRCAKHTCACLLVDDELEKEGHISVDEVKNSVEAFERLARGKKSDWPELSKYPVLKAAAEADLEVLAETSRHCSYLTYNRLVQAINNWHKAVVLRREGLVSLENYTTFRRADIAVGMYLPMIEMSLEISLSNEELECPDYLAAVDACSEHAWMVNDLTSVARDINDGNVASILHLLLTSDPSISSFQDAVNRVCSMIQEKEKEFIYYHDIATRNARESNQLDFLRYLAALPHVLTGNLLFHNLCGRYHGANSLTGDILHGTCHLRPEWLVIPDKDVPIDTSFRFLLQT